MTKLLFICIENANRSQMAEAFAKIHGEGIVEAYSAGARPSGELNPRAIEAMKEIGYDLTKHASKSLREIPSGAYEYVVSMGCGDTCPWVRAKERIDWNIPDPQQMEMDEFRKVRELIELNVLDLLKKIRIDLP